MAAPQNARWLGCGLTLLLFAAVFLAWTPQCSHAQHISSGVEELELPWWTNSSLLFNASHSIWFLPGALPGLALNFAGYRFIGTTIFLVAATLGGALFYVVSPKIFPDTPFCCGHKGSLAGHIVVSLIVGLAAGLFARWLLKVGIFLVGSCLGLLLGLGLLASPLHTINTFQTDAGVICLYLGCMLVFGCLTLIWRKPFLVLTTSFGGSMLFILGVDFFVQSDFSAAIEYALHQFRLAVTRSIHKHYVELKFHREFSRDTYILLASWLVLAVIGVIVQYHIGDRDSDVQRRIIVVRRYPINGRDDDYDDAIPLRRRKGQGSCMDRRPLLADDDYDD